MPGAGELNKRVTLQQKTVTRAANGEEIVTWSDALTVWAKVDPIRGREFFAAAQMQGAVDYRVTIRYRAGIDRAMRVKFGSDILELVAEPINVKSRNQWIELMCVSGVRDG